MDARIEQRVHARIAREGFWRGFLLRRTWTPAEVASRVREIRAEETAKKQQSLGGHHAVSHPEASTSVPGDDG